MRYSERKKMPQGPYKPEPNKNQALTDEEASKFKRRLVDARRAIEDAKIDRELGLD